LDFFFLTENGEKLHEFE